MERFNSLSNYGQQLANSGHYATPEIHQSLSRLQKAWSELIQAWQEQYIKLFQAQDLQVSKKTFKMKCTHSFSQYKQRIYNRGYH